MTKFILELYHFRYTDTGPKSQMFPIPSVFYVRNDRICAKNFDMQN